MHEEYSYELSPDSLVVGGYNLSVIDSNGVIVAESFFIAESWDKAAAIAKAGFESGEWANASEEGHTHMVTLPEVTDG